MKIIRITIAIFLLINQLTNCSAKTFYIINKCDKILFVETIFQKDKKEENQLLYPKDKAIIQDHGYMIMGGPGKFLINKIKLINIYYIVNGDLFFDITDNFNYHKNKIITINNNLETPRIKYLDKSDNELICTTYPTSISYKN